MALQSPVVSLATHVERVLEKLYRFTFRMECTDDNEDMPGLDVTYDIFYRPGDSVADIADGIIEYFQDQIDIYKTVVFLEIHADVGAAIANIQGQLSV